MNLVDLFAAATSNLRERYLNLARFAPADQGELSTLPVNPGSETEELVPKDRYEPTGLAVAEPLAKPENETELPSPSEQKAAKNPDGTYYCRRKAQMDYQLDLRFDLGTFTRTVQSLADGDTKPVVRFAAAGFGFQADFELSGVQTVETNLVAADRRATTHAKSRESALTNRVGQYSASSRNFAVQSFFHQAAKVRRSLDVKEHNNHRRAVNRFAVRFKMDNRFSFVFGERFNVQTARIADERPDQVSAYLENAGQMALKGQSGMMTSFFDAVEGYLDETEQNLLESTIGTFDAAVAELGFSGEIVDTAREQLTTSVQGFFDRVATALDTVESQFAPSLPESVEVSLDNYFGPALAVWEGKLATA